MVPLKGLTQGRQTRPALVAYPSVQPNASKVVASQFFWLLASMQVVLSISFTLRLRKIAAPLPTKDHFALARGQRKDSWLACAVIWIVLFTADAPFGSLLVLAGTVVIAWLCQRTVQRFRLLRDRR